MGETLYSRLPEEEQRALYANRLEIVLAIEANEARQIHLASLLGDEVEETRRIGLGVAVVSLINDEYVRGNFVDPKILKLTSEGEKFALANIIHETVQS